MAFDYSTLIRPDIFEQPLEQWSNSLEAASKRLGIPIEKLAKLSSNENLFGPSPKVREAVRNFDELYYYPDPLYVNLRGKIAEMTGAPADRIIVGSGLDEIIQMLHRVLLRPGDAILDCPPSFEAYQGEARLAHGRTVKVPRRSNPATLFQDGFTLDLDAIERAFAADADIKMLWLTSPNNPDGAMLPPSELERLLKLPAFVLVDEAYTDFAPYSFIDWTSKYENLGVMRTFSKGPALAGLRVGYGVFPKLLADNLWKVVPPFNVNSLGVVAALAALDDWEYTRQTAAKIIEEREKLFEELHQFSFLQPYRSHGSFILCKVNGRSANDVRNALARQGVLIRVFDNEYTPNHIRISIGTPREMKMVVVALGKL
jgi:histidinol-phosphate aminotransferase